MSRVIHSTFADVKKCNIKETNAALVYISVSVPDHRCQSPILFNIRRSGPFSRKHWIAMSARPLQQMVGPD